jgi:hypothetical protein
LASACSLNNNFPQSVFRFGLTSPGIVGAGIINRDGAEKLLFMAYAEVCPATFKDGYTQTLMQRLRDVSSWTVSTFCGRQDKSLRNHQHDWTKTSRPEGFAHLNDHYKAIPGWQFCLSANEHGRVHGIIIDDTFFVIWLDQDHKLYS